MNLLDRVLEPFAPGLVAQRMASRTLIQAYEAAQVTRTHKAKRQASSADRSLQRDAVSLREQCRKLDEDHDMVTGLFDRLEERVVGGPGIGVEPLPLNRKGEVYRDLAADMKGLWAEWSLRPEASQELTRPQVERLVCRTWLRDGEALAQQLMGSVPNYQHAGAVPYALELLEPDYLPFGLNDPAKGIVQGIERNNWRQVKAFHLLKQHPGNLLGGGTTDTKRVPVERMLHIANRKRIGQNRGVPLLHAVLTRLADIKDYEESERVAARISAALAMYIKKGQPDQYVQAENGVAGPNRTFPIGPGMVIDDLRPGEDIGMIESNRPNPFLEGFRNGQLKLVAAGTRVGYSSLARDYAGSYSSQRQELVESQLGYDLLQHEFIDYWCRPTYRNFLQMAVLSRAIKLPRDLDMATLYGAVYQGPVMPWIDPKKEAEAWELLVKAGFADEAEVARARQRNPQELKTSRTSEVRRNREDELVFSSDAFHQYYGKGTGNGQTEEPGANPGASRRAGGGADSGDGAD